VALRKKWLTAPKGKGTIADCGVYGAFLPSLMPFDTPLPSFTSVINCLMYYGEGQPSPPTDHFGKAAILATNSLRITTISAQVSSGL
jgi:hypothetical protein